MATHTGCAMSLFSFGNLSNAGIGVIIAPYVCVTLRIGWIVSVEQRQSIRKVLKIKAILTLDATPPMQVRTLDIGDNGMCVSLPHQLKPGTGGHVAFVLFINGKSYGVGCRVRVAYSLYNSRDGFKSGLEFQNLDMAGTVAIGKYMN